MSSIARNLSKWTQQEVQHLFENATAAHKSKELTILVAPSLLEYGRIMLTTPKKIGDAPTRNKLRRRLKSIFYEQKLYMHGKDLAFLTKPGIDKFSFEKLETLLIKAIKTTNVSLKKS